MVFQQWSAITNCSVCASHAWSDSSSKQQPANVQCLVRPLGVDVHCFSLMYFVFPFCQLELLG